MAANFPWKYFYDGSQHQFRADMFSTFAHQYAVVPAPRHPHLPILEDPAVLLSKRKKILSKPRFFNI